jgi:hypothetical protein
MWGWIIRILFVIVLMFIFAIGTMAGKSDEKLGYK